MTGRLRIAAITLAVAATAGGLLGSAIVYFGWYDVSATSPHTIAVHHLMDTALTRAVKARSADIQVPDLDAPERIRNGSQLYRAHCAQCHGGPGVAPQPYALGLHPAPAALVTTARTRPAADIFWITRQGIKMTGMPAWQYRLTDAEIWDVVAFMRVLPTLSTAQYRDGDHGPPPAAVPPSAPDPDPRIGDAAAGQKALHQYLCVTCHAIPGVAGAWNHVGPSLAGIADRPYIAGVLTNTPANMQRWLQDPGAIKPGSAMPTLGIPEQDARDIATFLGTLSNGVPSPSAAQTGRNQLDPGTAVARPGADQPDGSKTMPQSKPDAAPKTIPGQPDVNAGALRPSTPPGGRDIPDIDHPPPARSHDGAGFDRAVAQEEAEARSGTLPGSNDTRPAKSRVEPGQ